MAHTPEKKRAARQRFVGSRQTLEVIALAMDIPLGTLRRWKADARQAGDDWDTSRAASLMQGEGHEAVVTSIVEDFVVMFQATMDEIRDAAAVQIPAPEKVKLMASLSDSFNKMIAAAGRSSPKLSKFAIATDVLRRMADFIQREYPAHGPAFVEVLTPFGEELSK